MLCDLSVPFLYRIYILQKPIMWNQNKQLFIFNFFTSSLFTTFSVVLAIYCGVGTMPVFRPVWNTCIFNKYIYLYIYINIFQMCKLMQFGETVWGHSWNPWLRWLGLSSYVFMLTDKTNRLVPSIKHLYFSHDLHWLLLQTISSQLERHWVTA